MPASSSRRTPQILRSILSVLPLEVLHKGHQRGDPLRREGMSRLKSFWYGQASGIVEPIAGVLGALLVVSMRPLLPYALAFAAGAMIFVVTEELIPESQRNGTDIPTVGVLGGFTTFSSFSLQTLILMRDGEWLAAGGNVIGSVVACVAATWVGFEAASR